MNKSIFGAAIVASFIAGAVLTYQFYPQTKTVEKVVEKEVVKRDVVTVTKYLDKDGKVKKETTKKDNSTIVKDRERNTTTVVTAAAKPQWHVSVSSGTPGLQGATYDLNLQRRILGNVFLGGSVNTNNQYMLTIGMEF